MKNNTLWLLVFLLMSITSFSQVQVGSGTYKTEANGTLLRTPFNPAFGYSYAQSIYLSSEINASGNITSIKWYFDGNSALPNSQYLDVYMGVTSKTKFDDLNDFIPINSLTKVYTGGINTFSTPGWKIITLPTPFAYNGEDNLVIAVHEQASGSDGFNQKFHHSLVEDVRSIVTWSDNPAEVDISNPGMSFGTVMNKYVPNIIFGNIKQDCEVPMSLQVKNILDKSASISWLALPQAPAGGSDYYLSTSSVNPVSSTIPTGHINSGNSLELSELESGTQYYMWVRNNCGDGKMSSWSPKLSFMTDCSATDSFSERFDTTPDWALPTCWSKIIRGQNLALNAEVAALAGSNPVSAPKIVELYSGTSDPTSTDVMLVSPAVSNLSAGTHKLEFYARGMHCDLEVGTMSSNNPDAVFVNYRGITLSDNPTLQKFTIEFKDIDLTHKFIAFRVSSRLPLQQPYPFVDMDNISWQAIPTCAQAENLTINSTAIDGAEISWDSNMVAQHQVFVAPITVTDPSNLTPAYTTTLTTQVLAGLSEATSYNVWVRSVCDNEVVAAFSEPIIVRTDCSPISSFNEEFSSAAVPNLPNCWTRIIRGETVSPFAWVSTDDNSNIFSGANIAVSMNNAASLPLDDVILVSPNLSTLPLLATYRMKFFARYSNDHPADLEIGTLSSNTSVAVFSPIQVVELSDKTKEYTVEFNEYTGADKYIGIRMKATVAYTNIEIDNIRWNISPTCLDVSDIVISNITDDGAKVSWIAESNQDKWDVAVGMLTDTNPNSLPLLRAEVVSEKLLEGLQSQTNYKVWVRSFCGDNEIGDWIGPKIFRTGCEKVESFYEDFSTGSESGLPECWNKVLRGNTISNGAFVKLNTELIPNSSSVVTMYNSDSAETDDVILVSPRLSTLQSASYRLRFISKGSGVLQIGTLSSGYDDAGFNLVKEITSSYVPKEWVVDFNGYSGTDEFIGIRLKGSSIMVHLDDIYWEPIPECPDVNGLKIISTTKTSASFYWDAHAPNKWEIAVGAMTDVDPNQLSNYINTDSAAGGLNDLKEGTSYKVWVRSVCESNHKFGTWRGPLVITTQCQETSVPYTQNFESAVDANLPECTSSINISEGPYNWKIQHNPGYGFANKTLFYDSDLYTDANAWFFTRGIALTAGQKYKVSFRYGGASTDTEFYNNSLKVMLGNAASPASMNYTVFDNPFFATNLPVLQENSFVATSTGVFYFGFNVYSPNNSYVMYVDDIVIDIDLANDQFNMSQFAYFPNPVKDVLNISYVDQITDVSVYNVLGQKVVVNSINGDLTKVDMANLTNGTYIVKVVSNNLVQTIKVIKQ